MPIKGEGDVFMIFCGYRWRWAMTTTVEAAIRLGGKSATVFRPGARQPGRRQLFSTFCCIFILLYAGIESVQAQEALNFNQTYQNAISKARAECALWVDPVFDPLRDKIPLTMISPRIKCLRIRSGYAQRTNILLTWR
jgi:hypothetical protein